MSPLSLIHISLKRLGTLKDYAENWGNHYALPKPKTPEEKQDVYKRQELEYLFREWEMERDPEEMIRESIAPVRQSAIGRMLVGRELEEINWEPRCV